MYKSDYLNRVFESVNEKYGYQKEYVNAVAEFLDSMEEVVESDKNIEKNSILERLVIPERIITFRVSWVDDNGKIQVNNGYRVQFNSAIGPYKGGIRFDKSVNESILKFLGFEQTFKNSLTGLPMGGAKGGSDFQSKGKSDGEIMRFCQAFMSELYHFVGAAVDVPAGDLGVGAKEIGYMYGMYKKLTHFVDGTLTGKGLAYGGSNTRKEATGFGVIYFTEDMLQTYKNETLEGKKVIVSGTGNVACYTAYKAYKLGAKVLGMSSTSGFIADPDGLDIEYLVNNCQEKGKVIQKYLEKYPNTLTSSNPKDLFNVKCDICLPCATQNEIDINEAKILVKNGCYMVVEGANMPTTREATKYLQDNGVIFAPGKASNAGGVAVSGLEMSQNAMHLSWSFEEVDAKLKEIMHNIFVKCYKEACNYNSPTNLLKGANIAGFKKVYEAMLQEGVI